VSPFAEDDGALEKMVCDSPLPSIPFGEINGTLDHRWLRRNVDSTQQPLITSWICSQAPAELTHLIFLLFILL
jgi:hypothetical protein